MKFAADLHIHSRFSRATSRELTLSNLHGWAQRKGLTVVGTGDFTHPAWRGELAEQLVEAEPGLFALAEPLREQAERDVPPSCRGPVRFLLQVEISTIYKAQGKTRKVHHIILCPTLDGAEALSRALERIGNLSSDGRPILGLDSRDLLEILLESCPGGCLIPAHLWTPWFSVLGSKSGFDRVSDCYRDLSGHIFAVETGLSSDPPMNWRISELDRYSLVSNSDAHSPAKLARECNLFDTELSYFSMLEALKATDPGASGFLGTIEFFPQEGKYHLDGHRKCDQRLLPSQTQEAGGRCPSCGRPITVGVLHRVEELADRPEDQRPDNATDFRSLIGLAEAVGHALEVGPGSKKVTSICRSLCSELGHELGILLDVDQSDIERIAGDMVAESIGRIRRGQVSWDSGFDGEYGRFTLFEPGERSTLTSQISFFGAELLDPPINEVTPPPPSEAPTPPRPDPVETAAVQRQRPPLPPTEPEGRGGDDLLGGLNSEQLGAVTATGDRPLLIIAGPGTGKTKTLTTRIAYRLREGAIEPTRTLALTFTNKAAEEMAERLFSLVGSMVNGLTVTTFHSWGLALLRATGRQRSRILDDRERIELIAETLEGVGAGRRNARRAAEAISIHKSGHPEAARALLDQINLDGDLLDSYEHALDRAGAYDFDDLVLRAAEALEQGAMGLPERPAAVFVDEYQDLNPAQVRLLHAAIDRGESELFAIGDPDQAIYSFRGADPDRIVDFERDWPGAEILTLDRSYRSSEVILGAASQIIARTPGLERPRLWSGLDGQPHLILLSASSERAEAERIALLIEKLLGGTGFLSFDSQLLDGAEQDLSLGLEDVAVLFRTRNQGQPIAEALGKLGLPVNLGTTSKEELEPIVMATLAALRLSAGRSTPEDDAAAEAGGWNRWIGELREAVAEMNAVEIVDRAARELASEPVDTQALRGLRSAAARVDAAWTRKLEKKASFVKPGRPADDLLDWIALHKAIDEGDERAGKITLTTLHASKGLEWKVVVIAGCEDGLIPHRRPKRPTDLDEERRLFFVGMTRAEQLLVLSHAEERRVYGVLEKRAPSPFLAEIEDHYTRREEGAPDRKRRPKEKEQMSLF